MHPCCLSPEPEKNLIISKLRSTQSTRLLLIHFSNAVNRERLVAKEYAYHDLEDQRVHWRRAEGAYQEHEQARADHTRHRKYRSYVSGPPLHCVIFVRYPETAETNAGTAVTTVR